MRSVLVSSAVVVCSSMQHSLQVDVCTWREVGAWLKRRRTMATM